MKICNNCGAEVSDTAKFCRKCGAKLEAAAAPIETDITGGAEMGGGQGTGQPLDERAAAGDFREDAFHGDAFHGDDFHGNEFRGEDYQWGPPTGGENYDEPAMPAVFIGDAETEETQREGAEREPYTYRIEAPGFDHTRDFDPKDISENKVTAMAAYLLGPLGVIIALLAAQDSPYAKFHMRQSLKFVVVEALIAIIAVLLCWTLIIPAAAGVILIILNVIKIITIVQVGGGKAVEPAIIRSLGFLK